MKLELKITKTKVLLSNKVILTTNLPCPFVPELIKSNEVSLPHTRKYES